MPKSTWRKVEINGTPCLIPSCRDSEEWLRKTRMHQDVLTEFRRPRNIQHHRKLFALLAKSVDNWPETTTVEALLDTIKVATGHSVPIQVRANMLMKICPELDEMFPKGLQALIPEKVTVHWPKSIAFEQMDQEAFDPFYENTITIISRILGVDIETLETEAREQAA